MTGADELLADLGGAPPVDSNNLAILWDLNSTNAGFFRDVVLLFFSDAADRVEAIRAAAARGDGEALWEAAHGLKSSCGNIGATRMWILSEFLEQRGRAAQTEGTVEIAAMLEAEFDRVRVILEQELGRDGVQ